MKAVASGGGEREGPSNKDNHERTILNKAPATLAVGNIPDDINALQNRRMSSNLLLGRDVAQDGSERGSASWEMQTESESHRRPGASDLGSSGSADNGAGAASQTTTSNGAGNQGGTVPSPNAFGSGLQPARSRKGSLRKNILRKGGMQRMQTTPSLRTEGKASSSSTRTDRSSFTWSASPNIGNADDDDDLTPSTSCEGAGSTAASRRSSQSSSSESHGQTDGLTVDADSVLGSLSRSSAIRDTSTTDEDEKVSSNSGSNRSLASGLTVLPRRSSGGIGSYFPPQAEQLTGLRRRPSHMKLSRMTKSSPLSALPLDATSTGPLSPEAWDYGDTEWWGWVILLVTWITFVVGMGSCFGAWSWAWDVGKTPYAPPELEDDPTLPIVGYYPALLVLTGVMAWAWVIIAWVGMKYFKHAKMAGDDG